MAGGRFVLAGLLALFLVVLVFFPSHLVAVRKAMWGGTPSDYSQVTSSTSTIPPVAKCVSEECVRGFVTSGSFNPIHCRSLPSELRDRCFFIYEFENPAAGESIAGEFCRGIGDEDLRADCVYRSTGRVIDTKDVNRMVSKAIFTGNASFCDNSSIPGLMEECTEGLELTRRALGEKNELVCNDESVSIQQFTRTACIHQVIAELNMPEGVIVP